MKTFSSHVKGTLYTPQPSMCSILSFLRGVSDAEYLYSWGPSNLAFNGLQRDPSPTERVRCQKIDSEKETAQTEEVTAVESERESVQSWSGSPFLLFWQSLAFDLLSSYEQQIGHKYEWVVYIRPDMEFKTPIPSSAILHRITRVIGTRHIWYMENNQNYGV
jgi:hypothetical protein